MKAPDPLRQSSIARWDACPLSLKFAEESPVRQPSNFAALGTLFHRWVARAIEEMRAEGQTQMPVDHGMSLLLEILAQRDVPDDEVVHLPMSEIPWLRIVVTKWCQGGQFNAARVVAVEERLHGVIYIPDGTGGMYERIITGKPDVLVADPPDGMIVVDWKSGWAPPAKLDQEDREHQDQGLAVEGKLTDAGYAQQVIYGTLVLQNYPAVNRVTLREAYVRYGEFREATVDRFNLERLTDVLTAVVAQMDAAFAAGPDSDRWIPTAGPHCAMCPAPRRCPLKEWEGIPTNDEEALLLAREWIVAAEVRKERAPLLKGYVDANGPIAIDHGKGRRVVGWVEGKGGGRSFKLHEPTEAPESPFDRRLEEVLRDR